MSRNAHRDPRSAPERTQHTHAAGERSVVCTPSPYGTAAPLVERAVPTWCSPFATSSFHSAQLPSPHLAGKMWAWQSTILTQPSGKIWRLYSQSTSKWTRCPVLKSPQPLDYRISKENPPQPPKTCIGSRGFVLAVTHEEPWRQAGRAFGSHHSMTTLLEVYSSSQSIENFTGFHCTPLAVCCLSKNNIEPLAFPPLNPTTPESILYPHFYQQISKYTEKQSCFMLRNQFCWQHCQKEEKSKIP